MIRIITTPFAVEHTLGPWRESLVSASMEYKVMNARVTIDKSDNWIVAVQPRTNHDSRLWAKRFETITWRQ